MAINIGAEHEDDHAGWVMDTLDENEDCIIGASSEIGKSILRPRTAPAPALNFYTTFQGVTGSPIIMETRESSQEDEEEGEDTAWAKAAVAARTETAMPMEQLGSDAFNSNMFRQHEPSSIHIASPKQANNQSLFFQLPQQQQQQRQPHQQRQPQPQPQPVQQPQQQPQHHILQQMPQQQALQHQPQLLPLPQQAPQQLFNPGMVIQPPAPGTPTPSNISPPILAKPFQNGLVKQPQQPQQLLGNNMNITNPTANGVGIHKNVVINGPKDGSGANKMFKNGPMAPAPSQLLQEFRRKTRVWELPHFAGHVLEFSRDQDGSRLIQKKLEQAGQQGEQGRQQLDCVFGELLPEALQLMTDVFGNYVIQKLLEYGADHHRVHLVRVMQGCVVELTKQTYGCRVVQKALDVVTLDMQQMILSELHGHVPECVVDQNGNHVIQKCIECLPMYSAFIIESFQTKVPNLATHPYGCRVLQKILEYGKANPQSPLAVATVPVIWEIISNVQMLVMNQNGNYVVQHVMSNTSAKFSQAIVGNLLSIFTKLSCHKFASNVAEKVYQHANQDERILIVRSICTSPTPKGEPPLFKMMGDQFGNYVIQKVLNQNDPAAQLLIQHIKPHFHMLHRIAYGKHIISKIERLEGRQMNAGRS
eukprot:TRINITY_DN1148_c0_g1_i2.p1 TRINITY_DN1148_c0_g1~~TRINITY_DN1148_c0_g1_i2.p1  ORF type:complete len:646 (+),score=195.01 TRINITY_DN1148_c0_g1_i2:43-1980(+)